MLHWACELGLNVPAITTDKLMNALEATLVLAALTVTLVTLGGGLTVSVTVPDWLGSRMLVARRITLETLVTLGATKR